MVLTRKDVETVVTIAVKLIDQNIIEKPSDDGYLEKMKSTILDELEEKDIIIFNPRNPNGLKEIFEEYNLSGKNFPPGFELTITTSKSILILLKTNRSKGLPYYTTSMLPKEKY